MTYIMRPTKEGLDKLIEYFPNNSVMIEIGSYAGESAKIFLDSGKIKKIYCIDPWLNGYDDADEASHITPMAEIEEQFDSRLKNYTQVEKVKLKSADAVLMFDENSIDVVYIDGSHQYEEVKRDISLYLSKVKVDGLIAGHDYGSWANVTKAVNEIFGKPHLTFDDNSWAVFCGTINENKEMTTAICAIVKDERESYLQEWIYYHFSIGFDHIFIYDNGSQIPVSTLVKNSRVTVIDFPGHQQQVKSYNHFIKKFTTRFDWCAFIDVDEFIVLHAGNDISRFLCNYAEFGGLSVNRRGFGSNHLEKPITGSQTQDFTKRDDRVDYHIKSIVNMKYVLATTNPHYFSYSDGKHCVDEKCCMVCGPGNDRLTVDSIQLNHYFFRSKEDWNNKISRGDAVFTSIPYNQQIFDDGEIYCNKIDDFSLARLQLSQVLIPRPEELSDHRFSVFNHPKVSVFTPTHNPKWLTEAYNSLRKQTYNNWEWIILPNGKKRLDIPIFINNDSRVKVLQHTSQEGIGLLKFMCCQEAIGDLLLELDHDDWLTIDCLQKVVEARKQTGADFIYSDCINIKLDDEEEVYDRHWGWEYRIFEDGNKRRLANKHFDLTARSLYKIGSSPNHVRVWSSKSYQAVGGHNGQLKIGDDHDLICRTYLAGYKFHYIPEVLYYYRVHDKNSYRVLYSTLAEYCTDNYLYDLITEECRRKQLPMYDLGESREQTLALGFIRPKDNIKKLENNSVGCFRAQDFLQYVPNETVVNLMNTIYNKLVPGGWLISATPSVSDSSGKVGRGALCNPYYRSYWSSNAFWPYINREFTIPGSRARFQSIRCADDYPSDWHKTHLIPYVVFDGIAMKGQRSPGYNMI